MKERVEWAKNYIHLMIRRTDDLEKRIQQYLHAHQVANFCVLLAMKRKEDPELAAIAGLLHDCYTYSTGEFDNHAQRGALMIKNDQQLVQMFHSNELDKVCKAIEHHSSKMEQHTIFDEILKDADVLAHYFENNCGLKEEEILRLKNLKGEFSI